jgi:toxin FitB
VIVMDSTGWLEMFLDGPSSAEFKRRLDEADVVLVPSIAIFEVYKVLAREASVAAADEGTGQMQLRAAIPLSDALAIEAADYSLRFRLPMADAIIYATACAHDAVLVTGDSHFEGLPRVEYLPTG